MTFLPFRMERWQSTWEHRVRWNLSESGVHPLTVGELLALSEPAADISDVRLGYSQSNGTDELRALIAGLHPGTTDASVMVTVGGAEANFVAFWELAQEERPAAVMLPNYMQVPGLIRNFRGGWTPFHLREEDGWRPDLGQLEDALKGGAGFIVLTHPNNPTGVALTVGEIDEIVALADRHGAWILSDEVYRGAETGADAVTEESPSFHGRYDRVLVTNSLSKAYGLPGTRLGWVVGPEDVVERLWARTDYTTIAPPSVSDALARIALSPQVRPRILERTRTMVRDNLRLLQDWVAAQEGRLSFTAPDAGAIAMVRYDAPVPSLELAEMLRVEHSLLIVPGAHFGIESTMRLGFGPPEDELAEALEVLGGALAGLETGAPG